MTCFQREVIRELFSQAESVFIAGRWVSARQVLADAPLAQAIYWAQVNTACG